jgi:leucyl/phenylalanyl-tRNA--protein transferase
LPFSKNIPTKVHLLTDRLLFPNPRHTDSHGLVAIGGDLKVERLKLAYESGIFPWYSDGEPICWWSPDPRMVFDLRQEHPMKVSKSLRQSERNKGYHVQENVNFEKVMRACMQVPRKDGQGTWINEDMITAYTNLHKLGLAKSIEVYKDDQLVGGLYGVDLMDKKIFCGESMFSLATDSSKVALKYLIAKLKSHDYYLLDAQIYNDHLHRLGAIEMDRGTFLDYL